MSDQKKGSGPKSASQPGPRKGPAAKAAGAGASASVEDATVIAETTKSEPAKAAASSAAPEKNGAAAASSSASAASAPKASSSSAASAAPTEKGKQASASSGGGGAASASTPPPPPPSGSKGSSGGGLFAGVIGGVVGAVGALLVAPMTSGVLPPSMALVPESRLAAQVGAREAAFSDQNDALAAELAEAMSALAATQETVEALSAELSTLADAQTAAEETVASAQNDASDARALLQSDLDALTQSVNQREATRADTIGTLRDQVSALAAAIASIPEPSDQNEAATGGETSAAMVTRVALLEGALRRLDARVNGLSAEALPTPDLSRIDLMETRVRDLTTRVGDLEDRPAAVGGGAALGVAFAGLAQALAGSAPYETELSTLETVAQLETPATLADPAATGLPSVVSLATRFETASIAGLEAIARDAAASGDATWTDQLANRLSALVVVRRTDEVEGDAPDAVMSRVQARLDEGDIAAAMLEIDALPQVARDAMEDWLRDARARAGAEQAFADLKSELLSGE